MAWTKLVDMKMDDEDILDMACPINIAGIDRSEYPYGLRICLTDVELDKLGLPAPVKGDLLDCRIFAEVTDATFTDHNGKMNRRVELQIQRIAVENEATEMPLGPKSPLHTNSRS